VRVGTVAAVVGVTFLVTAALVIAQGVSVGPEEPSTPQGPCEPRAALESPPADGRPLRGIVPVGGWAVDLASPAGTGVTEVHVYLDGYGIEPGHTFIGRAEYGASRVDVAQQFNDARFAPSAFSLSWDASTAGAGAHTLVVLYRTRCGWASLTQTVLVDGPTIVLNIDSPPQGSPVSAPVRIEGWAADPQAAQGTGVTRVDLYLDGQITTRGVPLGEVPYGEQRPDVGASLGGEDELARARFSRSGFALVWNPAGVAPGTHSLTFYAQGPSGAVARSLTLQVTPAASGVLRTPTIAPIGTVLGRSTEPFSLAVVGTGPTAVALSWSPVSGAVTYDVLAAEGVAAFFNAQTGLTETRATISGLAPGRSYRFMVRALDATGAEIAHSNIVNITTSAIVTTPTPIPTNTPLPSPTIPGQF